MSNEPKTQAQDPILQNLTSFYALNKVEDKTLKGTIQPPYFDLVSPAFGKSNTLCAELAMEAAADHGLRSPRFDAVEARFSDLLEGLLLIPVPAYDPRQPNHYEVTWSVEGKEFRIDLAYALLPKGWETPRDKRRRVPVSLHRNLPGIGTALFLNLKAGQLQSFNRRRPRSGKPAAQTEAAAAKAPEPDKS